MSETKRLGFLSYHNQKSIVVKGPSIATNNLIVSKSCVRKVMRYKRSERKLKIEAERNMEFE